MRIISKLKLRWRCTYLLKEDNKLITSFPLLCKSNATQRMYSLFVGATVIEKDYRICDGVVVVVVVLVIPAKNILKGRMFRERMHYRNAKIKGCPVIIMVNSFT